MSVDSGDMKIQGYNLFLTSGVCPEQYDVFKDGDQVGYLRLRHGFFTAESPDCGGELVYEASPIGDGNFERSERYTYLNEAINAIRKRYEQPTNHVERER